MRIEYASKRLEKILVNERLIKKYYGHVFKGLISALTQLKSVDNLSQISQEPPLRRHKYKGHAARWSVNISNNYRLVFDSIDSSIEDIRKIKEIIIVEIVDPH